MAIILGGLSQKEALRQLGISRATMTRYRKHPEWPGDGASWEMIRAFHQVHGTNRGRKGKPHAAPSIDPADPDDDDAKELDALRKALESLDSELKMMQIEKTKAGIERHHVAILAEYREEMTKLTMDALGTVFDAIANMDLTHAQLENVRLAIDAARTKIETGEANYQPTLL